MTTAEKLRIMEELWADLTQKEESFESPPWHEAVLRERDERLKTGEESPVDWEAAKKDLRDRLT